MSTTEVPGGVRRYSLRRRLLLRMSGALLILLLLIGVGVWIYARKAADYAYDQLLEGSSLSILGQVYARDGKVLVDLPYAALNMLSQAPDDRVFYQVLGPSGKHLTGYKDLPLPTRYKPSAKAHFFDRPYSGETVRFVLQSRHLTEQGVDGWVTVEVGQTRIARRAMTYRLLFSALGMLTVVILCGLAFVGIGINRALAPLTTISRELRQRSPTDFQPFQADAPMEITPLVDTLNAFIRRLHGNLDAMQVFIADAAHQIRTPLATLQAHLDMASRSREPEEWQERIDRAQDRGRHLIRLTNQLLSHAMVNHRGESQTLAPLDLGELLKRTVVETVRDRAHTKIEFAYHNRLDEAWIDGDALSLKEAFRNLLDNAIKYGPDNNLVTVELRQGHSADQIDVRIEDQGPGIEPGLRERSLKRFERLQPQVSGSGLGLAIVEAVAVIHDAQLTLADGHEGGLAVILSFRRRS